ncbi:PhzF family phenazine biosynthesis protein [Lysinibacter cavernae]|uniref:PhzF family phenazine biosynthesis protein n=1 Tax=Lysinibacter cavernae TaxID=1640652 RepID=A0A7X5QY99_9MICO|nr:PhzF family phenazine biosynthesis protein [Lysinibacter cavernae]NIH52198.1 PhzF family phenazine biosynthesis protein [Lysinibacter cavernae]
MTTHPFSQVDVFTSEPMYGNPVAVVHDADGLSDDQMAAFARWTNLSETTFLLSPTAAEADYRLRIFTPGGELPFAGHPTLGSCHAWIERAAATGAPVPTDGTVVQECEAGLIRIAKVDGRLAFTAPPLVRSGRVADNLLSEIAAALGLQPAEILDANWVDNGPGWLGILVDSAETVLRLTPNSEAMTDRKVGVIGKTGAGEDYAFEVRAFYHDSLTGLQEDPVTGSLNASLAQWLIAAGTAPTQYIARQGTVLKRRGRIHVAHDSPDVIWVGGDTVTVVSGTVTL